jgi:polyferredoxin
LRTAFYAAIIAIVGGVMLYTLATRRSESVTVIHDRNPIFVRLADGSLRNAFTMHILNKALETRLFELTVEGVPNLDVKLVGDTVTSGNPLIVVGPDQTRELRALLTTHAPLSSSSAPLTFTITDSKDGSKASTTDHFRGP